MTERNLQEMTLNQIWRECLRMWKWIVSVWGTSKYEHLCVEELKDIWLERNNYLRINYPNEKCFFCDWQKRHSNFNKNFDEKHCDNCPGELVNIQFYCCNKSYHYSDHPKAFYNKLLKLDKKRKQQ